MNKSKYDIEKLIGKTISSVEVIMETAYPKAEFGRTYGHYVCFVCSDSTKLLIADGIQKPYNPEITIEEMKKAPNFFSPDDIAERVRSIEIKNRRAIAEVLARKRAEYEQLKKEFGD